jgi:hypothetical protein
MIKVIWKFPLEVKKSQLISVPEGSVLFSVQVHNNIPVLYALIYDAYAVKKEIEILSFATGDKTDHESVKPINYLGSYQNNGADTFHLFVKPHNT